MVVCANFKQFDKLKFWQLSTINFSTAKLFRNSTLITLPLREYTLTTVILEVDIMEQITNHILLIGNPTASPVYSHSNHGRDFYTFPLEVSRLSGTVDRLPILIPYDIMIQCPITESENLCVTGQLRTYNSRKPGGRRLILSVLAQSLSLTDLPHDNQVQLFGTICKEPNYRRTPLGREICDIMLAVNRNYRRADYIPCILWGKDATAVSPCPAGTPLTLTGRLQSRDYTKLTEDGKETRTTYEVSAITASPVEADR